MAAGRQNFLRRRQETDSCGGRFDHRTSDHRRNGSIDGGGCRFVYRFEHELQDGKQKKEVDVSANGSIFGSIKKRKFSPVVWDRVEKQVKISSKNRVHTTSSVITPSSSSNSLRDCGSIEKCLVPVESDCRVYSVDSFVSDDVGTPSSLATRTPKEHDQEIKNEDGEYVGVRNLSKSKWAFEDSPRFKSNDSNSSPESGEIKQEAFGTSGESSSLSKEDEHDSKNVDNKADSASIGYLSSESGQNDHETSSRIGLGIWLSCRNVFEFERLGKISEGTYGVVYKARDKKTGDIVALKKVKVGKDREGFPVTALREINILGGLRHPLLVEMKEVVTDDFDGVYMVMEYVVHELKGYMEGMRQPFSQSEVKRLMLQLLEGVSYLHDNYVMHRDLKTSNLLLNNNGELKICDFGLSRQYASPLKHYSPLVVTLWYRAPELLLGIKNYSTAVDVWSIGCIMAELLSKKPLFNGNTELEQINKIFRTLGTPNELSWPGYSKLPGVKPNFVKQPTNALRKMFPVAVFTGSPTLTELGFDLLNRFLTYDPEKRITAKEALDHGWFRESPLPAEHVKICK